MSEYLVRLFPMAHEVVCVDEVRLCQVDEPIQHQAVAKISRAEYFNQLVGRPLREEHPVPLVLHDTVITTPKVGRLGKTSFYSWQACSMVSIKISGNKTFQSLNLSIVGQ